MLSASLNKMFLSLIATAEMSDDDELTPEDTPPMAGSSELVLDKPDVSVVSTADEKHVMKVQIQNGPGRAKNRINTEVIKSMNKFARKQKRGTIDVWWLFDDGGKLMT